ncbi:uncharacterized protein LOC132284636 [Cornus florida]|uniref:uncharacterized protein LOC132284636 n=1 Tax=Cornus florida TaxID=4283 RepID=UPI00289A30BA|nr:uncharacterized protein LOC132284636 [Cornus florida]XP_059642741.1 uncharacterized protein LOC132284636 [Cornus florida]XP_059642742.1 uncharacterized protein LOC132284636 [Cornus florida]
MAATTKKLVWVNGYGNLGGDDGKFLPCINVELNFRVEQTYHLKDGYPESRTRDLITRDGIGEISSRRPYKYLTYDLLYSMIHGMKIPFTLEKMQCEQTELENTDDLIRHALDVARFTVNRYCNSGQKLFRLDIYIVNRLILPHAQFEAINLAKEQVERWFRLHQKVNRMILSKSFSDFGSIHGEIGRMVRETATFDQDLELSLCPFLDNEYDEDLELSLLERAMREYFQETIEPVRFEGDIDDHGEEVEVLCVICKDEIVIGSPVIRMPFSHRYHVQCIAEWPLCRFKLSINKSEEKTLND